VLQLPAQPTPSGRQEFHLRVGLPLVDLETERELAVACYEPGLDFRANGGNPALGRNILWGLQAAMKTKQNGCEK
jgi:hypothetical protein